MSLKDPSYVAGRQAGSMSLSEIINNGMTVGDLTGFSGNQVAQDARRIFSDAQNRLLGEGTIRELGDFAISVLGMEIPYFIEYVSRHGLNPGSQEGQQFINLVTQMLRHQYNIDGGGFDESASNRFNSIVLGQQSAM